MSDSPRDIAYDTDLVVDLSPRDIAWQLDEVIIEPPPGGGTGGSLDNPSPAFPVLVPTNTTGVDPRVVLAGFQVRNLACTEGQSFLNAYGIRTNMVTVRCILNRPPTVPIVIPYAVAASSTAAETDFLIYSRDGSEAVYRQFEFGPDKTEDTIYVDPLDVGGTEGDEYLVLELDPSLDPVDPGNGLQPVVAEVDNFKWPFSSCIIRISDAVSPGTPAWNFVDASSGEIVVPEGVGTFQVQIQLDQPAVDTVTIRVVSGPPSSGVAATPSFDFDPVDNLVEIAAGETIGTLDVTILDDGTVEIGPNEAFDLTGTIVSGSVVDGSLTVLRVEIEDDDVTAEPKVTWAQGLVSMAEGTSRILTATVSPPFATVTDVPVTLFGTATEGTDFTLTWPTLANTLRFQAGQAQSSVTITAHNDLLDTEGTEYIAMTLTNGSTWGVGPNTTITVNIQDSSAEPTTLNVQRGLGVSRSVVEGLIGVREPSTTLPRFNIAGEDCQVVGMDRDALGRYLSVWVAGIVDGDAASYADEAGALEIVEGEGTTPAESGVYTSIDLSGMKVRLKAANVATPFERVVTDTNLSNTAWTAPVAESPMFPAVGAELFREDRYLLWLKNPGDATADTAGPDPEDRCCLVDLVFKRYVGVDVIEVTGALRNQAWDSTADPFTTSDTVDGDVHMRYLDFTGVPTGWAAAFLNAHPLEGFSGSTATVFASGSAEYDIPTAAVRPFRFALYKTATTASSVATKILGYNGVFDAVGGVGPTRVHCYGETADVQIDHGKAGFQSRHVFSPLSNGVGWRGVVNVGAYKASDFSTRWAAGTGAYYAFTQRFGAAIFDNELTFGGAASGNGIDGAGALVPSPGWRTTQWYKLVGASCRHRLGHIDPLTGANCFSHVMAEGNGGKQPFYFGSVSRQGAYRHPQFNESYLSSTDYYNIANKAPFTLAPVETRATATATFNPTIGGMTAGGTLTIDDGIATPTVITFVSALSGAALSGYSYIHVASTYDVEVLIVSGTGTSAANSNANRARDAINNACADLRCDASTVNNGTSTSLIVRALGLGAAGNSASIAESNNMISISVGTFDGGVDGARPWNQIETDLDPYSKTLRKFESWDSAHAIRLLTIARDGWWMMRSPVAYWLLEDYAAYLTRVYTQFDIDGPILSQYGVNATSIGVWLDGLHEDNRRKGYWITDGSSSLTNPQGDARWQSAENHRAYAWTCACFAAWYAIAGDELREATNPATGKSWPRTMGRFLDYVATDFGALQRQVSNNADPNPYDAVRWGPIEPDPSRESTYPSPFGDPTLSAGRYWSFTSSYMQTFLIHGVYALQLRCLDAVPAESEALDRIIRFIDYTLDGARVHTTATGGDAAPDFPIVTRGSDPYTDVPVSLAEYRAGANWHRLVYGPQQPSYLAGLTAGSEQKDKLPWASVYAARRFPGEREYFLERLGELYGFPVQGAELAQAFNDLYTGGNGVPNTLTILYSLTSDSSGNILQSAGQHTWMVPWLAEVQQDL